MLKVVISGDENRVVRLSGKINEAADLSTVSVTSPVSIEVDLIDVTLINSIGIRQFKEFAFRLKAPLLTFSYCPRVFIDQVNMVVDLIPKNSRVKSFYVPFYSEDTGEEKNVLFMRGEHFTVEQGKVTFNYPKVLDSQSQPMEIDVLTDKYFRFLSKF